jgi:hypothetical protein
VLLFVTPTRPPFVFIRRAQQRNASRCSCAPPKAATCGSDNFSCQPGHHHRCRPKHLLFVSARRPIMLLSHFQRAARTVLPFRHLALPLPKPLHALASAPPHRSFKLAPNHAPTPHFFPSRSFATSPPPSEPPLANPAAPTQQPAAPAATAFLRSSVFWGDTKPG